MWCYVLLPIPGTDGLSNTDTISSNVGIPPALCVVSGHFSHSSAAIPSTAEALRLVPGALLLQFLILSQAEPGCQAGALPFSAAALTSDAKPLLLSTESFQKAPMSNVPQTLPPGLGTSSLVPAFLI